MVARIRRRKFLARGAICDPFYDIASIFDTERRIGISFIVATHDLKRIGDLQLQVLQFLWREGEVGLRGIFDHLRSNGKSYAYTTVATVLDKMDQRGLVHGNKVGGKRSYSAAVTEDDLKSGIVGDVVHRVFTGDIGGLIHFALGQTDISPEAIAEIESLIEDRKRELNEGPE